MTLLGAASRLARALRSPARRRYILDVVNFLSGVHPRQCNLCGGEGLFLAAGQPPRYDARCPVCGSLERHRLLGLFLEERPHLVRGRVLHFAAEPPIRRLLADRAADYATADVDGGDCDLALDLMRLDLADGSVDLFVLNHVLEHVPSDAQALRELHRCLAPGGAALITVPIAEGWPRTYEDAAVAAQGPPMRTLHFGQGDHLRFYGADFPRRLEAAGFAVETFTASGADTVRLGLIRGEKIFLAIKDRDEHGR